MMTSAARHLSFAAPPGQDVTTPLVKVASCSPSSKSKARICGRDANGLGGAVAANVEAGGRVATSARGDGFASLLIIPGAGFGVDGEADTRAGLGGSPTDPFFDQRTAPTTTTEPSAATPIQSPVFIGHLCRG